MRTVFLDYTKSMFYGYGKVCVACNKQDICSLCLREIIVWVLLLEFLADAEAEEADGKHGWDAGERGRHALVQAQHTLQHMTEHARIDSRLAARVTSIDGVTGDCFF